MAPTTLLDLPSEILTCITSHFTTLDQHVHFSQTCSPLNRLYEEEGEWRRRLFDFSYGRPAAYSGCSWRLWAITLVKHANECVACEFVHAEHAKLNKRPFVEAVDPNSLALLPTLVIQPYLERRDEYDRYGHYDIGTPTSHLIARLENEYKLADEERCALGSKASTALQDEYQQRTGQALSQESLRRAELLIYHINAMSLPATNVPVKVLHLRNTVDALSPFWQIEHLQEGDEDYWKTGPSILYPDKVANEDGLTTYDVIRAGANWYVNPSENCSFGGLSLDKANATLYYEYVGESPRGRLVF